LDAAFPGFAFSLSWSNLQTLFRIEYQPTRRFCPASTDFSQDFHNLPLETALEKRIRLRANANACIIAHPVRERIRFPGFACKDRAANPNHN
jgi:hypothetical protein